MDLFLLTVHPLRCFRSTCCHWSPQEEALEEHRRHTVGDILAERRRSSRVQVPCLTVLLLLCLFDRGSPIAWKARTDSCGFLTCVSLYKCSTEIPAALNSTRSVHSRVQFGQGEKDGLHIES